MTWIFGLCLFPLLNNPQEEKLVDAVLPPLLTSPQCARKAASGIPVPLCPHHFCPTPPLWEEFLQRFVSLSQSVPASLHSASPNSHSLHGKHTIQHFHGSVPNISLNSHPVSVKILTALLPAPRASDPICITGFQVYFAYHFSTLAI